MTIHMDDLHTHKPTHATSKLKGSANHIFIYTRMYIHMYIEIHIHAHVHVHIEL